MIGMWPRIIDFLGYDPDGEPQTLRKQIVAYRRRQGLSRKHMAIMLGVDEGTMSRWERGSSAPRRWRLKALRKVLSLPDQ